MTTGVNTQVEERARRRRSLVERLGERNLVMGVLNTTPDSFSDGGRYADLSAAVDRVLEMVQEGADLIDIGGESSRPGAEEVSIPEEIRRVVPVIEAVRSRCEVPLSIDTRRLEVAREAFSAGADLVNDITACTHSPEMPGFVAGQGGGLVLMHMRGTPQTMQDQTHYDDVVGETRAFLSERAAAAIAQGLHAGSIWLDPGICFGKSVEGNLDILAHLQHYDPLGHPLVVGISRKSFMGKILNRPVESRLAGTVGLTGALAADGVRRIHRVHDVGPVVDCLRLVEALGQARQS